MSDPAPGPWFRADAGDPLLQADPAAELVARFLTRYGPDPAPGIALYTRFESGGLHCRVVAWLSPGAAELARELGAAPCAPPAPAGLDLRAGSP